MSLTLTPSAPPLRVDAQEAFRVGDTRVLFELVIWAFQDGVTPDAIVQRFPTLALADVYGAITYYLRHRDEVEAYLAERSSKAEEIERRIDREQSDLHEIRARLQARRQA